MNMYFITCILFANLILLCIVCFFWRRGLVVGRGERREVGLQRGALRGRAAERDGDLRPPRAASLPFFFPRDIFLGPV